MAGSLIRARYGGLEARIALLADCADQNAPLCHMLASGLLSPSNELYTFYPQAASGFLAGKRLNSPIMVK